jgi:hypothetical protein
MIIGSNHIQIPTLLKVIAISGQAKSEN